MDHQAVWDGVLRRLATELPSFAVESWVRPLAVDPQRPGLRLLCPTAFHRDRVRDRYLDPIARCAAQEAGRRVDVSFGVANAGAEEAGPAAETAPAPRPRDGARAAQDAPSVPRLPQPAPAAREQPSLPYTFDSFVVGECNALAQAAARELARGRRGLSPLFLMSASGLGKTHLARALVSDIERSGAARAIYSPAELFTNELTSAIRGHRTQGFKRRYRGCDVLVVEDVQFLTGKNATQLELFHTIEHLLEAGRRVVLTGDRLPREIRDLEPRLVSRMASGLVAEIERPDAQVRRRILKAKAAAGGIHVPDECLDRLVDVVRGRSARCRPSSR
jgi:chromosomal replication initiator protein